MNPVPLEPRLWSRARLWTMFAVVMVVQVALIVAFTDPNPVRPRRPPTSPSFVLTSSLPPDSPLGELIQLKDPTLFALPNVKGFSGAAWMKARPLDYESPDWSEAPRFLARSGGKLGATFLELIRTNTVVQRSFAAKPTPLLSHLEVPSVRLPERSTFRVEGNLATRKLLNPFPVPSMEQSNVLTRTVVQLAVNRAGWVYSQPVLVSSSGSRDADEIALGLAGSARFEPVASRVSPVAASPAELTWGSMVFSWRTLPVPPTNHPAATPSP